MKEIGAPGWTLTCDLSLRRGLLYTLSYRGFAFKTMSYDLSLVFVRIANALVCVFIYQYVTRC